jgi:hypothetical protein
MVVIALVNGIKYLRSFKILESWVRILLEAYMSAFMYLCSPVCR